MACSTLGGRPPQIIHKEIQVRRQVQTKAVPACFILQCSLPWHSTFVHRNNDTEMWAWFILLSWLTEKTKLWWGTSPFSWLSQPTQTATCLKWNTDNNTCTMTPPKQDPPTWMTTHVSSLHKELHWWRLSTCSRLPYTLYIRHDSRIQPMSAALCTSKICTWPMLAFAHTTH